MIIILREQIMSIKSLERRLLRLEKMLLNESVKLDLTTVFDHPKPDREKYILDQLSKLKPRSKLLGIGDRGYIFIITKIDDNNYEFAFNSSSKSIFKSDSIIDDILRDRNSYYEFPKSVKLIKKNSRHYAKRQYTFMNNKMDIKWFEVCFSDFNKTVFEIEDYIDNIKKDYV